MKEEKNKKTNPLPLGSNAIDYLLAGLPVPYEISDEYLVGLGLEKAIADLNQEEATKQKQGDGSEEK